MSYARGVKKFTINMIQKNVCVVVVKRRHR